MSGTKQKRAPRRTAAEWAETVERYRRSGLTVPAFAAQEGVGAKRLRIWLSRLQRSGIGTRLTACHSSSPRNSASNRHRPFASPRRQQPGSVSAPFLPLRLHSNDNAAGTAEAVEVTLEAGTTVRLSGRFAELFMNQLLSRL